MQPGGDEPAGVDLGSGRVCERLEPERRSLALPGELACLVIVDPRRERLRERHRLVACERTELDRDTAVPREQLAKRRLERRRIRRGPAERDQRERRSTRLGRAHEVVTQRERKVVDPLKIVDEDQCRSNGAQCAMRGLEHPHRLEHSLFLRRPERERV